MLPKAKYLPDSRQYEYDFKEPGKTYTLLLDDEKNPTKAFAWVWVLAGDSDRNTEIVSKDIEAITGRPVRLTMTWADGHEGAFDVEVL